MFKLYLTIVYIYKLEFKTKSLLKCDLQRYPFQPMNSK